MSFVALAGQDKAILIVSCGASDFNFNFLNCFLIHPNSKMTAKNYFLQAGWHTRLLRFHDERPYHVRVESQVVVSLGAYCILFTLESQCILIRGQRRVQRSNQKIYLSQAFDIHIAFRSSRRVKNYIMLLAPINYLSFRFQLTEIPILAKLCAPWKKTLPLWRTGVGDVGALLIPKACLQLGGQDNRHSIRGVILSHRRFLYQKVH